ncbi:hypothetical protein ACEQPO_14485 [Bacillus sp. SL00103]
MSVVLIHAIAILSSPQQSSIFTALLMFSTPSFIFISEFLLAHAYPNGTPKGFMWKRIKAIFFPFCIYRNNRCTHVFGINQLGIN